VPERRADDRKPGPLTRRLDALPDRTVPRGLFAAVDLCRALVLAPFCALALGARGRRCRTRFAHRWAPVGPAGHLACTRCGALASFEAQLSVDLLTGSPPA